MSNYVCPHCGESDYYEQYSTSTCMYSPPHYRNGILVEDNPNYCTTYCQCAVCGQVFVATTHQGDITYGPISDSPEVTLNMVSKKVDVLLSALKGRSQ